MEKIKKAIGLDQESCNILKKKEGEVRKLHNKDSMRLLSSLFEDALLLFCKDFELDKDIKHEKIVRRQTVYISEKSNAIYNKMAFKNKCTLQQLVNLIIKTIYG